MFRCPACHTPLAERDLDQTFECGACRLEIANVEGLPLLVRDRDVIEATIASAKQQGLDHWYTKPQLTQWTGPYRHHILKRKQWLEGVLTDWRMKHGAPSAALDLGCGDGSNLTWLNGHFPRLYGSDYNILRLMRAAKLGFDVRLFMADILNYPTEDDAFDVIFFNHVLEHIRDDAAALREVRRILKPGGLLILGVPNEGAAFWQFAYRLQPKVRATSDHVQFYTGDALARKCEAVGLSVKTIHPIGWGVPHWTLDAVVRQFKIVDDVFEAVGRRFLPSQATSLYLLLSK
jgi:SAM-dependent methyltransferase